MYTVRLSGALRAALFSFVSLLACTSERLAPGQCEFDRDCSDGQLCVDQYCRNPCTRDADCPNGRCVPTDTPGGRACRPNAPSAPACTRDSDCEAGQACFDGRCLAQCRQDYDCRVVNPDSACVRGRCTVACPTLRGDCDGNPANGCETDLRSTPPHCGACGRSCPDGMVCSNGTCSPSCSTPGELRCGDRCVDPQTNVNHCGRCDNTCPAAARATSTCTAGRCTLTCERGFADCDGNPSNGCETDLSTPTNCGMCGRRCVAPTPRCMPSDENFTCTATPCPFALCDGMCVDPQTHVNHCGACGNRCPAGPGSEARCEAGRCQLRCTDAVRTADCDGLPATGCETVLASNPSHCGACGTRCPDGDHATATCTSGRCTLACDRGFGNCDGDPTNGCETDTRTSTTHCGRCGNACSAPANAIPTCTMESCGFACVPGFADCDRVASNGCEVHTSSDRAHCGACGNACSTGQVCSSGRCNRECAPGETNCSGSCANLALSTSHCGACNRACPAPPNATPACAEGTCRFSCTENFGDCDRNPANGCETSLLTSATSCGACGNACALPNATAACSEGSCVIAACNPGFLDCDGRADNGCEVDGRSDRIHCGACRRTCSLPNATAVCSAGSCAVASCNAGFADCDRVASNGCEVDTRTHTAHCGGCGNACSAVGGTPSCTMGTCSITCASGRGNCDGNVANGCEVPLDSDPRHCGRCGNSCTPANATPACTAGTCGYTVCNAGFADCDRDLANGCEVDTRNSVAHCGACGRTCAPANATPACTAGTCGYTVCNAGFADCDRVASNGCEVDTRSSVAHCGACGRTCAPANATPACTMGTCGYTTCHPGFGDCDDNRANGCETSTQTSTAHCGACGRACPPGQVCSAGSCTLVCGPGLTTCGGACVDTATDPAHCGRCGNTCTSPPNAIRRCAAGVCGFTCNAGFADCNGNAADGCEANTQSSTAHCGGCGRVCAPGNAIPSCSAGVCGYTACNPGFADCDRNPANGCEVNLHSDPSHCGRCGSACRPANATPTCSMGVCGYSSCNPGFGDCDRDPANGCETDTQTTVAHCGGCGRACSANNGTPSCSGGACAIMCDFTGTPTVDPPGFSYRTRWGNCDGDARSNGCETNLLTVSSCHACGQVCSFPNATPDCNNHSAIQCSIASCNTGFANCNGVQIDGCEVNTTNDNAHCGGCGRPCLRSVCRQSACRPTNDACSGATAIDLTAGRQRWLSGNTSGALHDLAPSCVGTTSPDLFFTFTLTQRELVYADTFGDAMHPAPTYDTVLFFASSCSTSMPATAPAGMNYCNDDASSLGSECTSAGNRSQIAAVLEPGTYYLVLSGFGGQSGTAWINFQHLPLGNLAPRYVGAMGIGANYTFNGTTSGTGVLAPAAMCSASGPELTFWWRHCPSVIRYNLSASTCNMGSNYDTVLYYRNAYAPTDVCNDDLGSACRISNTLSAIYTAVPGGVSGIHAVTVDGYSTSSMGNYVLTLTGSAIITELDPMRGTCRPRDPRHPSPPRRLRATLSRAHSHGM